MSVYIAAPYQLKGEAEVLADLLSQRKVSVTSSWLHMDSTDCDDHARLDLADIRSSDALVALNPKHWSTSGTGGRHVELGYALALGKKVFLFGSRSNVFHYLSEINVYDSIEELLDDIEISERQRDAMVRRI